MLAEEDNNNEIMKSIIITLIFKFWKSSKSKSILKISGIALPLKFVYW